MQALSTSFIRRHDRLEWDEPLASNVLLEAENQSVNLRGYLQVVRKYLWLIVAIVSLMTLSSFLYAITRTPLYTAHANILITSELPLVIRSTTPDAIVSGPDSTDYYQTQCNILRSRSLADQVIESGVFLGRNPPTGTLPSQSGASRSTSSARGNQSVINKTAHGSLLPGQQRSANATNNVSVGAYLAALKISHTEETSLIDVAYTASNAELAARVANAHVAAYIERGIAIRSQANREAQNFLEERLGELKQRLEESEQALNVYRREKGIVPGLISLNGKNAIVVDRLADLGKELTRARVKRIEVEASVNAIHQGYSNSLPQVTNDEPVAHLIEELNASSAEDAALARRFTGQYPPLQQLRAKERALKRDLDRTVGSVVSGIKASYASAKDQERQIEAEIDKQRVLAIGLNVAAVKYAILERDVDANREMYDSVLQAIKKFGVAAETRTSNVSIIDRAEPPSAPSSPKLLFDVFSTGVLSIFAALGLAFLLDHFDDRLTSIEAAEQFLHLPDLGAVPDLSSPPSPIDGLQFQPAGGRNGDLTLLPSSVSSECFRSVRTALLLSRPDSPPGTTLITSALSGEGKTLVAVNTALAFAQLEAKVLLIDCDLRRPNCHGRFEMNNHAGLTEVITGSCDLADAVRKTQLPRLSLLPAGSIPPNPTELLGSARMREIVETLRQEYSYIVLDSPPLLPVADAVLLATMVDEVILVIDSKRTSRRDVTVACNRLSRARVSPLGFVLNKLAAQHTRYYRYYESYERTFGDDLASGAGSAHISG